MNVEVKPKGYCQRAIPYRGLRYACPRLPTSDEPMCITKGQGLAVALDLSSEPLYLFLVFVVYFLNNRNNKPISKQNLMIIGTEV